MATALEFFERGIQQLWISLGRSYAGATLGAETEDWRRRVKDLFGRPVVTAAELDEMTSAQRREAIQSRIVWDLSELPEEYVARLRATAEKHRAEREGGEVPDARAS